MWIAWLAWLPALLGGGFHARIESLPASRAQSDPGFVSRQADRAWRNLCLRLLTEIQARRSRDQEQLAQDIRALPEGSVDTPENHDDEMATQGTYGQLPEVLVDRNPGAMFPVPIGQPSRFSWYQTALQAGDALKALDRFETGAERWRGLTARARIERFREVSAAWDEVDSRAALLAQQARYLESWVPPLAAQWRESQGGTRPLPYRLISALGQGDPRLMDALREVMRPIRSIRRPYLPERLPESEGVTTGVELPIATDVTRRKFLAEVEGALATHWNQSSWARELGVTFRIRWTHVPTDVAFGRGRISLDEHLARFPTEEAAMTTGGLTTYVRGQALVLGPGKINPRTLAHELGHLMGFDDCYLRTLSSQGLLGVAVLEWDNPLYPDDIMCDNTVGAARAEVW